MNITSIRNKLSGLSSNVENNNFDILTDFSFPNPQFLIKGYKSPIRLDISGSSGGLMIYVNNGLSFVYLKDIKIIPFQEKIVNDKFFQYDQH